MALTCQDPSRGYLRDILEQPEALRVTLEGLRAGRGLGDIPARLGRGDFRRVVLTGMCSSLHALYPLHYRLIRSGFTSLMIETSELVHHACALLEPATLLVAVSQSGRSAETLRLLERAGRRAALIAVTNTPDSPLALGADRLVLTRAGAESSVSCKTYVSALMALAWLGEILCGEDPQPVLAQLEGASEAARGYLADWEGHVRDLMPRMEAMRHLFLVGRGNSLAAARTGGLIIKESAHAG